MPKKKKPTKIQRVKHELFHVKERMQLLMFMGIFAVFGVAFIGVSNAAVDNVTIDVVARGSTGEETLELLIENEVVDTWTLTTSNQRYNYVSNISVSDKGIKLRFTNDGRTASGGDRNAIIDYIEVEGQRFDSSDPSVYSTGTYSRDTGCAPGNKRSDWLGCNGYMQYSIGDIGQIVQQSLDGVTTVDITARGDTGEEEIELRINDRVVEEWTLTKTDQVYSYISKDDIGDKDIEIHFSNDKFTDAGDRNVRVDFIEVNGQKFETEAPTVYTKGSYTRDTGCNGGFKQKSSLECNGYIAYAIGDAGVVQSGSPQQPVDPDPVDPEEPELTPEPEPTPENPDPTPETPEDISVQVNVRAKGDTGDEIVQLVIAGKEVAEYQLTRNLETYTYISDEAIRDRDIRVTYNNDGRNANGIDKNITVDYISINGTRVQTEAASTLANGVWRDRTCREVKAHQTESLQCNGYFEYSIGELGQVSSNTPDPDPEPEPETPTEPEPPVVPETIRVDIRAKGDLGNERLELRIREETVYEFQVTTDYKTYSYTSPSSIGNTDIKVYYVSDGDKSIPGDPNPFIDYIRVNGTTFQTESSTVKTLGLYKDGTCKNEGFFKRDTIQCNGWFQYSIGNVGQVDGSPAPETPVPPVDPTPENPPVSSSDCTLYVTTSGNDGRNGRSQADAKRTPNSAINAAGAGDVICVGPGTYKGSGSNYAANIRNKHGTETNPIVFRALDSNNYPTFEMNGVSDGGGCGAVCVENSSHIVVEHVHARNSMKGVVINSSNNVDILNCRANYLGQEALHVGKGWSGGSVPSSYVLIEGCDVSNTGNRPGSHNGTRYNVWAELIYVGTGDGSDTTNNVTIRNNYLHDSAPATSEAIDIKSGTYNIVIEDNRIDNVDTWCEGAIRAQGRVANIQIRRNVISNVTASGVGGNGRACGNAIGIRVNEGSTTGIVEHNVVWDADQFGLLDNGSRVTWRNNTTFSNRQNDVRGNVGGSSTVTQTGQEGTTRYSASDFVGPVTGSANANGCEGSGFTIKNYRGVGAQLDFCKVGIQ